MSVDCAGHDSVSLAVNWIVLSMETRGTVHNRVDHAARSCLCAALFSRIARSILPSPRSPDLRHRSRSLVSDPG